VLVSGASVWSYSPDRRHVVVAVHRHADLHGGHPRALLRFVDASKLRVVRNVALGRASVTSIAWLTQRRVLALSTDQLIVVDSAFGRVVERQFLGAETLLLAVRTAHSMVALTAPLGSIGPARLLVFDERGSLRRVVIEKIAAGEMGTGDVPSYHHPGLAVEPRGARAYVVSPDGVVAEVDLTTLVVAYHAPAGRSSSLSWAKASAGPSRYARWLGDGLIAVSGRNEHAYRDLEGYVQLRNEAAGLKIVDTRSWTVRTLDPNASGFSLAGRQLLATAWLWDSAAQRMSGIGLAAYTFNGRKRFHLFERNPVTLQLVFRGRAYVGIGDGDPLHTIVDLARGRVVGTLTEPLPWLLLD
jgi:hypothetical protein